MTFTAVCPSCKRSRELASQPAPGTRCRICAILVFRAVSTSRMSRVPVTETETEPVVAQTEPVVVLDGYGSVIGVRVWDGREPLIQPRETGK